MKRLLPILLLLALALPARAQDAFVAALPGLAIVIGWLALALTLLTLVTRRLGARS